MIVKDRKGNDIGIGTRVTVRPKGTRVKLEGVIYDVRHIRKKPVVRVVIAAVGMKAQFLARSVVAS